MNCEEFSNVFDTLVSSYRRFKDFDKKEMLDSIEFDEYEKSLWLTAAQEEVVIGMYTGRNVYGESFEVTEEIRRSLENLVKSKEYLVADRVGGLSGVSDKSVFYTLPSDLAYIVFEKIVFSDAGGACYAGRAANVFPATHDEYNRIANNPFRGATALKALRLDYGNGIVEIISNYGFDKYFIRYISNPEPIILEDLPEGLSVDGVSVKNECKLNKMLHSLILKRAVKLALASKGIQVNS